MTQTQAQTTDLQSIENTINHYFEGMISHNAKSIEKAFHPTAIMKWNEKGEYMEVNAVQALSEYLNLNEPIKTKTKIVAVNLVGDAANAQLELMNINGEWKIVSKTYTTVPKDF